MKNEFDMIVIGSGMGGMTTATALSRKGHKVLLLEQAQSIGGLTHAFSREGFSWDVGLHYCGTFGHDQSAGRILDWQDLRLKRRFLSHFKHEALSRCKKCLFIRSTTKIGIWSSNRRAMANRMLPTSSNYRDIRTE